ncbi:hypothetical protein Glove_606g97 [Diversispora epigaea]|uniref:Uncharacterized protein n=1 Tax=Diversispora epigaea TaxID=1348612 RepID=A0A397GBN5_9GLOM|nr:hypothetical protein Glove_606g97 [Diversispora epigaea]
MKSADYHYSSDVFALGVPSLLSFNEQLESNDKEIIDFLENLLEKDDVQEYFQLIDYNVPTEENFNEEQITNLVQSERNKKSEESDSDDEEILLVSVKDAISRLETFIKYILK